MTLAITDTDQLESSDVWLATNATAWCNRMSTALSAAACEQYRNQHFEGRCFGCGGLNQQARPPKLELPELDIAAAGDRIDGFDDLDKIIDSFYEDPVPGDDFDDVELDLDDETLLKLFPELTMDDDNDTEKRFTEYQEAAPRYAIYHGRCKRCGGYMENTREWHDDNVFHCLECGWRTGPEYEINRAINGGFCE